MASKKDSWFSRMWATSKAFRIVVIVLPIALIYFFVKKVKKISSTASLNQSIQDAAGRLANDPLSGIGVANPVNRAAQLQEIAVAISNAIWSFRILAWGAIVWYRPTEDEEAVIVQLNKLVSGSEAAEVSLFYKNFNKTFDTWTIGDGYKGESLRADVFKYLSSGQRGRIHSYVINNLS